MIKLTTILDTPDYGKRFVMCSIVPFVGVLIQDARPDHCSAFFRLHRYSKPCKVRTTSLCDVI